MPASIVQAPYLYSFSKNTLAWRFYVSTPAEAGCKLQVQLFVNSASDIVEAEITHSYELRPDSDGFLTLNVADIVDSMIDLQVPSGIVAVGTNIKKVTIEYRRISDANTATPWITTAKPVYVIKGGIELLKHDFNNYFYNLHRVNKVFATWQPQNRFIVSSEDWWMSILFSNTDITDPDLTERQLRMLMRWTDGTNATVNELVPASGDMYLLYHFNIGKLLQEALADNPTKKLWRIEMVVVSLDGEESYSEIYTLYADYRKFYGAKLFNFFNSVGGIDHVRVQGEADESYNRGYIDAELFSQNMEVGAPADRQYNQASHTRQLTVKADTGYRHTKAEVLAYQEILTSGLIFEVYGNSNGYRLVSLLNKSGRTIKSTDKRFAFALEWRYPFTEVVYTPEIELGVGYMPCEPAAFAGEVAFMTPDGQVDVPYIYSFEVTGTLPITLGSIVKPEGLNVTISNYTVTISGTPTTSGAGQTVSFNLLNCSGSILPFSDTIDIAAVAVEPNMTIINEVNNAVISTVTPPFFGYVSGSLPISSAGSVDCIHAGTSMAITVQLNGIINNNTLTLSKNAVVVQTISSINTTGLKSFTAHTFLNTDIIEIKLS